jgi:hypothetical protein
MQNAMKLAIPWTIAALALAVLACSKEEPKKQAPPASSIPAKVEPAPPPASVAPPEPATPPPHVDCPKGSSGAGTFDSPCEAKGAARMMEVTWNGKMDDKDPTFRVINKSSLPILHGKIAVYFYDKVGKQLEVPPASNSTSGKPRPYRTCSGSIFGGVLKPAEKAFINFSCVKKDGVPGGTKTIEAEIQMVGFADPADDKKVAYYWRNIDIAPSERKPGGVKK